MEVDTGNHWLLASSEIPGMGIYFEADNKYPLLF